MRLSGSDMRKWRFKCRQTRPPGAFRVKRDSIRSARQRSNVFAKEASAKVRMPCWGMLMESDTTSNFEDALHCRPIIILMKEAAGGRNADPLLGGSSQLVSS